MRDLFLAAGQKALQKFVVPQMLCLFDFDGTLAPLVTEPAEVLLPHAVQQRLCLLQKFAQVGIVTGRSLTDLSSRLSFKPDYLIGNHGLEGLPGWEGRAEEFAGVCKKWRTHLASQLHTMDAGIALEDKRYSLSLHYRQAHDRETAQRQLAQIFEHLAPLPRVIPGKCIFSLLPPHAGDKGQAVEELIRNTGAMRTLYVGDDITDEDVFLLRRDDLFPVRVGFHSQSAAPYFIQDRDAIVTLLDLLLACLSAADRHSLSSAPFRKISSAG